MLVHVNEQGKTASVIGRHKMNQVGELDPSATIWRYFTYEKFASLIKTKALWFSKLQVFEDTQEGMTPEPTRTKMKSQHRDMERWFHTVERKEQVRRFVEDNENNGRELIVANCWFIGEHESEGMWNAYAGDDGVVIRSTVQDLVGALCLSHDKWWIGKMNYIDFTSHERMNMHEGHQAHLRAFLKSTKYAHENELRVATMNWVAPGCLNPDGSPPNEQQLAGLVYSTRRAGILVSAKLSTLTRGLRVAPRATDFHRNTIDLMASTARLPVPATRSELS